MIDETFAGRRRRIPRALAASAVLVLSCCNPQRLVDCYSYKTKFAYRPRTHFSSESFNRLGGIQTLHRPLFLADSSDTDNDEKESWTRRASSSPLKVRNRVRAVLQRARDRTGIRNSSDDETSSSLVDNDKSAPTVTVEAEKSTISLIENITIDTSVTIKKKNGTPESVNGTLLQNLKSSAALEDVDNKSDISVLESTKLSDNDSEVCVSDPSKTKNKSAATVIVEPLPFTLPKLTDEQRRLLLQGERIQEQSKMGNEGSGYVVVDVKAPPYVVWECLLDFESYPETIPTVRDMKLFTSTHLQEGYHSEKPVIPGTGREARHYGTPSVTRAAFVLSKFRLNIAAIHTYRPHPDGDYMIFTLDPSCTNVVLQSAKGIWYTQACPEGREVRCLKNHIFVMPMGFTSPILDSDFYRITLGCGYFVS
jgi:hypothetical protein